MEARIPFAPCQATNAARHRTNVIRRHLQTFGIGTTGTRKGAQCKLAARAALAHRCQWGPCLLVARIEVGGMSKGDASRGWVEPASRLQVTLSRTGTSWQPDSSLTSAAVSARVHFLRPYKDPLVRGRHNARTHPSQQWRRTGRGISGLWTMAPHMDQKA